jgi:hypothetical protein
MSLQISEDNLPPGIPEEALPHLRKVGYLRDSPMRVGDSVPTLHLYTPAGEPKPIAELWRNKPVVLVFGSFT